MTWKEAVDAFLAAHRSSTATQYRRALDDFARWYRGTYGEPPEPKFLTDEDVREWRAYLTGVKKYAASTVNLKLSVLKGVLRHLGRHVEVNGVRKVQQPVDPLSARGLGRLLRGQDPSLGTRVGVLKKCGLGQLDGPGWPADRGGARPGCRGRQA